MLRARSMAAIAIVDGVLEIPPSKGRHRRIQTNEKKDGTDDGRKS